jgi:superoxide dismutase, Cu-Zn family
MTPLDLRNHEAARRRPVLTALFAAGLASTGLMSAAWGAPGDSASAAMMNTDGEPVGTVELTETANGTVVLARLTGLPEGPHAFHVHETGVCEPPFTSAGGHYNPDGHSHGFHAEGGPHAGDLPNIFVPASGELIVEFFSTRLEVDDRLFDDDGAAVVIHAGPDDHMTDPAGDAGPRIACGVLEKGPGN